MKGRYRVLDCWISRTDPRRASITAWSRRLNGSGGYVCFSNVHTVVSSRRDVRLRVITNRSLLSVPDGKPLAWLARQRRLADVTQVAGPDFMLHFIETVKGARHFFYGATPETLERLVARLRQRYPYLIVAGCHAPPFRDLNQKETEDTLKAVREAGPDVIWVGLGAPKQEVWMARHWRELKPAVLFGVGAAFDIHAGRTVRAPGWMRRAGLEWLFRLLQEPRRLWKRYFVTNSLFLYYLAMNFLKKRLASPLAYHG
jgi:N-acetylglucosaminyldiphosphoundecaprenol N-acetyl-beta-D-mannosaminyltransferase